LLEKPNKWIAKSEEWVSTVCNGCSMGCTLSMGVRNGKIVMVKPERLNPVSNDQICVRGRFHYDAIKTRDRLTRHLVREGNALGNATYEVAISTAADKLADVIKQHGPQSVGFLVAPWATNEEAFLTSRIARGLIGTETVDSTANPIAQAVSTALTNAFGSDALPADLSQLATAKTIVVMADDLESSNNIVALRVKDAVVYNGARLIVISSRYGEVCDFIAPPPAGSIMPSPQRVHSAAPTGVWLRPAPGGEIATAVALAGLVDAKAGSATAPDVDAAQLEEAAAIIKSTGDTGLAVVYSPSPSSPLLAGAGAAAAANIAIAAKGVAAAESLYALPTEPNVNGIRDMGIVPGAGATGIANVKALVVVGDNPMMQSRDRDAVEAILKALDALVVIDSLRTDTAELADVVFADLPAYGKDGTTTSADRRIGRTTRAEAPTGDQRDAIVVLNDLAKALATNLGKQFLTPGEDAETIMGEIAAIVSGYAGATYDRVESGRTRALPTTAPSKAELQTVALPEVPSTNGRLLLTTSRTLYTSRDGAAIHSEEADKLHREEFLEMNPADAAALGIGQNRPVRVANGSHELLLSAALTDAVPAGSVFLPLYYDGGIVNQLLPADGGLVTVAVRPA
jgi:predicted molibdopterin-dependent oxidoreductase YjgC